MPSHQINISSGTFAAETHNLHPECRYLVLKVLLAFTSKVNTVKVLISKMLSQCLSSCANLVCGVFFLCICEIPFGIPLGSPEIQPYLETNKVGLRWMSQPKDLCS